MEKNKKVVISGVLIVLVIVIFVSIGIINNKLSSSRNMLNETYQNVVINENYDDNGFKYIIKYNDMYEPGSEYNIYIYDNYDIIVDATHFTSIPGNEPSNIINKLVYKDDVKNELIDYFKYLFKNEDDNYTEIIGEPERDSYDYVSLNKIVKYDMGSLIDFKEYDLSKDYDYKLSYSLVSDYDIYKIDDIIKVKRTNSKDVNINKEYIVNFSEDNMKKIDSMFNELFKNSDVKDLIFNDSMDFDDNRKIIDAIINNEEIFMNYVFIVTDISCDCIPNLVYFNFDSYVVREAIITGENDVISRGKYDYGINKILNNLDNFEGNEDYMNYKITLYNDDEYIVSHYDLRMIGLLKGLDIKWH